MNEKRRGGFRMSIKASVLGLGLGVCRDRARRRRKKRIDGLSNVSVDCEEFSSPIVVDVEL